MSNWAKDALARSVERNKKYTIKAISEEEQDAPLFPSKDTPHWQPKASNVGDLNMAITGEGLEYQNNAYLDSAAKGFKSGLAQSGAGLIGMAQAVNALMPNEGMGSIDPTRLDVPLMFGGATRIAESDQAKETKKWLDNVTEQNKRTRDWTGEQILNDPIAYATDESGLVYDLGNQGGFMATTAPIGGFGGGLVKGALGLMGRNIGTKGTMALTGAVSGLPEAGIEGGAVYNELVAQGMPPEQAATLAVEVATKNIPLSVVVNAIQAGRVGKALEKAQRPTSGSRIVNATKAGLIGGAIGSTTGAAEEVLQEGVSGQAKGDTVWDIYSPSTWGNRPSDEQLTSAVVGGISGGAMTGVPGAIGGAFRKPQTSQTTEASSAPKDDANNTQTTEPAQPMQEAQPPNVSQDFGMIRQPSDYTPKAGDIAVMKDNDRAVMVTEGGITDPENVSYYISTAQQETQTTEPVAESAAVEEDDLRAFLRDKAVDASQPVEVSDQAYGQFVKRNVDGRLQNPEQAARFVQDNFADEFAAYKEARQQERAQKSQNAPDVAEFNIQDVGKSADIKGETQDVVPQTQQSPIAGMVSRSRESRQSAALQSQNGLLTKKKDVTKKQSLVDMTRRALAGDQSALQTFNLLRPAEREALANAVTGKTPQTAMPTSEQSSAIEQQGTVSKSEAVEAKNAKRNESISRKQKQVDMLSSVNPMRDDYHTGIRSADDIADTDKVFGDDFEGMYPDFTEDMAQEALSTGKIKVYSSKPIEAGAFVTPSKMNAQDYAGGKNAKVYEKTIPVEDVAWVDESEGQYAPVDDVEIGASSNKPKTPKGTEKSSQKVKEDDVIEFNLATDDKESREYRHEIMEKHGFSKDEIADLDKRIESIAEVVKDVSEKYTDFNEWQNIMSERLREKGVLNPKVNAFIANGEYKLNIDLGTLCIKREGVNAAIQAIIDLDKGKNRLVQHLGASQIWQMCDVLKKNDFLVPCEVCFVESKRVRALDTANAVSLHWKAVLEALGINDGNKIGEPRTLTAEQQEKLDRMARTAKKDKAVREKAFEELIPNQYKREVEVKKSKEGKETKTALDNGITPDKMAKIASLMKKDSRLIGEFDAENLLTSQNVDKLLQKYHGTGLAGFIAGSDGAATAKPLQGKHVYDGLSFRTAYDKTRNTAKSVSDIGGVRLQSFSDFDTLLFFDYVQAIADLEARRLTAHAYVKIPEFVEFFGETGIKTNMSLLFGISDDTDANGNKPPAGLQFAKDKDGNIKYDRSGQPQYEYLFVDESFGAKPGVSGAEGAEMAFGMRDKEGNVGTIGVGLSDEHIEKMLADDRIDMVIPYHASGMPNSIQVRSGLSEATDYSADQTTKMGGKKKDYPFNKKLRETGDPRKTAEDYLAWCEKNGYTPKFPQFAKGKSRKHYYKLLTDFRVYDGKGEYAPQKSVQLKLPSNIKTLLDERVSDRVNIVDKVNAIKANKELVQEMVDTITRYERIDGLALSRMKARLNSVLNVGKDDAVVSLRTKEFFNELDRLAEAGKGVTKEQVEVLRTSDKVVYGFAVGGKIYLNENYINAHTPAHEFTHIWAKVVKANNPKLWKQGVNLLKTDPRSKEIWDEVVNDPNYESIRDNEDAVASEVLARIVGGENEKLVKEIFNNANGKRATHTKSFGAKLMDWIKSFFGNVIDILGLDRDVDYDEFIKAPLGAIWDEEAGKSFNKALKKWQKMQDDGSTEMNMDEVSENAKFQIAYHGTPHIFDEFSLSGVGTGEGATAHGWGLYFAQNDAVAKEYRSRLAGNSGLPQVYYEGKENEKLAKTLSEYISLKEIGNDADMLSREIAASLVFIRRSSKNKARLIEINKEGAKRIEENPQQSIDEFLKGSPKGHEWFMQGKIYKAKDIAESEGRNVSISDFLKVIEEDISSLAEELKQQETDKETLERIDVEKLTIRPRGALLEVDIPESDVLLDEQKTFGEQPPKVQEAILNIIGDDYDAVLSTAADLSSVFEEELVMIDEEYSEEDIRRFIRDAKNTGLDIDWETAVELHKENEKLYSEQDTMPNTLLERIREILTDGEWDDVLRLEDHLSRRIEEFGDVSRYSNLARYVSKHLSLVYAAKNGLLNELTGEDLYDGISELFVLKDVNTKEMASKALNKHGVKGITYDGRDDGRCFVIFDDKAIEIKRKYDSAIKENKAEIKRTFDEIKAEVKKAFPNAKDMKYEGSDIVVSLPNGAKVRVKVKDKIIVNDKAKDSARQAHGVKDNREVGIQGYWQKVSGSDVDGILAVSKDSEEGTTYHESLHMAMDLALTSQEKKALTDHYTKEAQEKGMDIEETIANGYAEWRVARENGKGTLYGKLFQKMRDFWHRLEAVFMGIENAHNVMRKIENGEVWEREARDGSNGRKYAAVTNNQITEKTRIPVVDITGLPKSDTTDNAIVATIARSLIGKTVNVVGSNGIGRVESVKKGKHFVHSSDPKQRHIPIRQQAMSAIDNVLNSAVYVEKHDDVRHGSDTKYIEMYAVVKNGKDLTRFRIVAKEGDNNANWYEVKDAKFYDILKDGTVSANVSNNTSPTGIPNGMQVWGTQNNPSTITVAELLAGVKDRNGKPYIKADGTLDYDANLPKFSVRQTKKEKANSPTVEEAHVAATNNLAKKLFKSLKNKVVGKKNPDVKVEEGQDNLGGGIGLVEYYLASPSKIAEKVPAFKNFFQWAQNAMEKEVKLRSMADRKLSAAFNMAKSKEDTEALINILWEGDATSKEWTKEELLADGVKENVADAYITIRRLMTRFYKYINDARTGKQVTSKTMSEVDAKALEHNDFVTRIISQVKQEDGKVLVTYEAYRHWEKTHNNVTGDMLMRFKDDEAIQVLSVEPVDVNGETLYNVKLRERVGDMHKRTGYIPHFFHNFFVIAKVKDEDGNIVDTVVGSARSQSDAVKQAEEYVEQQKKLGKEVEGMIVRPKQFDFAALGVDEHQLAATVGDREYAKMVKKLETEHDMTLDEAKEIVSSIAKTKGRHRFFGNALQRKGTEGYEKDMKWVLRHFTNSASRYVALETEFKPKAISMYERMFGAFDKDPTSLLAKYIKQYIGDLNGNPTRLEEAISRVIQKTPWLNKIVKDTFGDRYALYLAGQVTGWTSVLKLGFLNASSALLNLSQLINASVLISDNPAVSGMRLAKAMKRLTAGTSLSDRKVLVKTGVLEDIGLDSGSGYDKARPRSLKEFGKSAYGFARGLGDKSMYLFKKTEELVRRSTVLAAYEQARAEGKTDAEAIEFAKEVNRKANFDYGVQDAPNIFRRGSIISQIVLQFKKYGIKEMELMLEMTPFIGKSTNKKQKAAFWNMYILLCAGLWQTPLMGLIDDLISFVTGIMGNKVEPTKEFKAYVYKKIDEDPESKPFWMAVMKGAPFAAGIDLSSRTGMADFFPSVNAQTLHGVSGSTAIRAIGSLWDGDGEAALRAISPSFANAYSAATGEKHGKRGRMMSKYEEMQDRIIRLAGFTSSEEAEEAERAVVDRYVKSVQARKKQEAIDDFLEAEANGDDLKPYLAKLKELGVKPNAVREERKRKRMTQEELKEEKAKNKKPRQQKEPSDRDYLRQ